MKHFCDLCGAYIDPNFDDFSYDEEHDIYSCAFCELITSKDSVEPTEQVTP
jgi:hypothetical protein